MGRYADFCHKQTNVENVIALLLAQWEIFQQQTTTIYQNYKLLPYEYTFNDTYYFNIFSERAQYNLFSILKILSLGKYFDSKTSNL